MAKVLNSSEVRDEPKTDFERFQEAVKTILTVPKEEIVRREAQEKKGKMLPRKTGA